jgi:hypothetical protein
VFFLIVAEVGDRPSAPRRGGPRASLLISFHDAMQKVEAADIAAVVSSERRLSAIFILRVLTFDRVGRLRTSASRHHQVHWAPLQEAAYRRRQRLIRNDHVDIGDRA